MTSISLPQTIKYFSEMKSPATVFQFFILPAESH